eukprot:6069739-Pleurochrysis_carterae.AAC.3
MMSFPGIAEPPVVTKRYTHACGRVVVGRRGAPASPRCPRRRPARRGWTSSPASRQISSARIVTSRDQPRPARGIPTRESPR